MRFARWRVASAIAWVVTAGCSDERGPRLDAVSPASAPRGARVELGGRRFCGDHVGCAGVTAQVQLGLAEPIVRANIVDYADTRVVFVVPAFAVPGTTDVILIVDGLSSNALAFEVLP